MLGPGGTGAGAPEVPGGPPASTASASPSTWAPANCRRRDCSGPSSISTWPAPSRRRRRPPAGARSVSTGASRSNTRTWGPPRTTRSTGAGAGSRAAQARGRPTSRPLISKLTPSWRRCRGGMDNIDSSPRARQARRGPATATGFHCDQPGAGAPASRRPHRPPSPPPSPSPSPSPGPGFDMAACGS